MAMVLTLPLGAHADVHLLYTTSVETARGSLTVQPYLKGRQIDWSTFQRDGEANEFRVTLNGHLVTTFSPREWEGIHFEAAYPSPKDAHLILAELWPGGNSCNGYFVVIEVPDEGKPKVSGQFGNCLDVAFTDAYKISNNPIYRDGAWYIGLEGTNPTVKFGIEWWVYKDGRVKQAGGQDPEAAKGSAQKIKGVRAL